MNELRLLFEKADDGAYTVRLDNNWGGGAGEPLPFKPFLTEDDHEDLRWYLEEFMDLPDGGSEVRARRVEQSIEEWGKKLFGAVFDQADNRELFNHLLKLDPPRVLTIATRDPDPLRLPWEIMANKRGPLTRLGVTIRRQLEAAGQPVEYETGLPLRILLVVSRPDDTGFIDPRLTTPSMLDALAPLGRDVVVDICRPPTLARVEEMLTEAQSRGEPYHIFHFDGHGNFMPDVELGILWFEKPMNPWNTAVKRDLVHADRLGKLLAAHNIPLVLLDACRSGRAAKANVFRSVAPRLIEAGVGSAVSMSHSVHVEAARILTTRFYQELVDRKTIGQALEAGRQALADQPHRWLERGPAGKTVALTDWFLPNLYQRGEDLRLVSEHVTRSDEEDKPPTWRTPLLGNEPGAFPPAPRHQFHGRARELHRLERQFRSHRAILLHAMGGMGKTSLAREAAFWWTRTGLFPDGACFVSFEQFASAERVVQVLGTYIQGAAFESLSAEEQYERAKELFNERDVLMVWDNFESVLPTFQTGDDGARLYSDAERDRILGLFRDWTAEPEGRGRLLVTCRPAEAGLAGARSTELQGLARPDSLHLLARVLQTNGVNLDDPRLGKDTLNDLLNMLADHPLSVELVGPHLKTLAPQEVLWDFGKLLEEFKVGGGEERNESLLASLAFSTQRLSKETQQILPWLGLFRMGVFEANLLNVSQIGPAQWDTARVELEATALVRTERDITLADQPYLRFHPTLVYAALASGEALGKEARQWFVAAYDAMDTVIREALDGSNPRAGMEMMAREEPNFRCAIAWAVEDEAYSTASAMGATFRQYLELSGRFRERDAWVAWLAREVHKGGFTAAAAANDESSAWSLFTQGRIREAIDKLNDLIEKLRHTDDFDPAFRLASAQELLGRIYDHSGLSAQAVPALEEAARVWEALIEQAPTKGENKEAQRYELSVTLCDLASALRATGRLNKAMEASDRAVGIARQLGQLDAVARGLAQIAEILADQGRVHEAESRYEEALQIARSAVDKELEAILLQHRGGLASQMQEYGRAAAFYEQALRLFQEMNSEGEIMRTCNLLGTVELNSGRLAEARAWYERSCQVARARQDKQALAQATHNIGIVCTEQAEAAQAAEDEALARQHLEHAVGLVEESLGVWKDQENLPSEAASHGQLAQIHLLLGELDQAEEHAHQGREILESLGLKEVHVAYSDLAKIARARGDMIQAAEWEGKRDAAVAELQRHALGGDGFAAKLVQAIRPLAIDCAQAGFGAPEPTDIGPEAENVLALISKLPAPLSQVASVLRTLAAGKVPNIPDDLPAELREMLTQLIDAVKEQKS